MKKRVFCLLSCIVCLMFSSPLLAKETFNWKIQTFWSASETPHKLFVSMCDNIKKQSDGRLNITVFPGGAVVPTFEMIDAVENNILQGMYSAPAYLAGRNPAFGVLCDMGAAWGTPQDVRNWFYADEGMDLLAQAYAPFDLIPLGVVQWGIEALPVKKNIASVKDLQGLKMRAAGGLYPVFLKKLGISTVILPMEEVFSALDKGVIDAADCATPLMNKQLGLHKVAKYFIWPSFHALPSGDITVNKKSWEKLPADLQTLLKDNIRQYGDTLLKTVQQADAEAAAAMEKEGAGNIRITEADMKKIQAIMLDSWNEYAEKNELTRKVIASRKAYYKKIGLMD